MSICGIWLFFSKWSLDNRIYAFKMIKWKVIWHLNCVRTFLWQFTIEINNTKVKTSYLLYWNSFSISAWIMFYGQNFCVGNVFWSSANFKSSFPDSASGLHSPNMVPKTQWRPFVQDIPVPNGTGRFHTLQTHFNFLAWCLSFLWFYDNADQCSCFCWF